MKIKILNSVLAQLGSPSIHGKGKGSKMNKITLMVILTVLTVAGAFQTAKAQFMFSWTKDFNGLTILTTPSSTNIQTVPTQLALFTSYNFEFIISNGILNIARQNILPFGPGGGTAYYGGPVQVGLGGNVINFTTWLTPSAVVGSSESWANIKVNDILLPYTVTANWNNPSVQFFYTSSVPIFRLNADLLMNAVIESRINNGYYVSYSKSVRI